MKKRRKFTGRFFSKITYDILEKTNGNIVKKKLSLIGVIDINMTEINESIIMFIVWVRVDNYYLRNNG